MLKNWDSERVAILDMIMLKMALCGVLYFPTIPTKVTLNEFVEISKIYSTDKSKDFINGILDRLMKKLQKEEKIVQEGRGLMERSFGTMKLLPVGIPQRLFYCSFVQTPAISEGSRCLCFRTLPRCRKLRAGTSRKHRA